MRRNRRLPRTACVVLASLCGAAAGLSGQIRASSGCPQRQPHVRPAAASIAGFLADGCARSPTFKALVDEIDALPGIVYVDQVVKLSRGMEGALLSTVTGQASMPILRVVIKTNLGRDRSVAVIAHELQHVIEVLQASRTSSVDMTTVFAALDEAHSTGGTQFETEAARLITARVLEELRPHSQRGKR